MQHDDCDHVGHEFYARITLPNGQSHFCIQCEKCLEVIKSKKHGWRLYIKLSEVPSDSIVRPLVERLS